MKGNYVSSSVDFSVLDELGVGDGLMINGILFVRSKKEREYNGQNRCYVYDFNNEAGVRYQVHVQQQIDRREQPGLKEENMRKKPVGATLCNRFDSCEVTSLVRR